MRHSQWSVCRLACSCLTRDADSVNMYMYRVVSVVRNERRRIMASSRQREILHLDVDAFFASVEQRDDPRLRGRPVAVGTGVVASCSYEARRYGVRTAMRLAEARQRCRSLIVVPGQYPRYEQVARQLLAVCRERTPCVEAAALDDLYLDLTHAGPKPDDRVARELWQQVYDEMRVHISVGAGSNKLVANVATKELKRLKSREACRSSGSSDDVACSVSRTQPLIRVPTGGERAYLAPWRVEVLPGAGPKVQYRLDRLNVRRVGQVADMPVAVLQQMFGTTGRVLHEYAHGIDLRPVTASRRPQSISRRTSFDPPVAEPTFLRAMLGYLLERASSWMRYHDLAAGGVTVMLRYGDYQSAVGHERLATATQRDDQLREAALERFAKLYTRRLPLRLLGVELTALRPVELQPGLFTDLDDQRHRRLDTCKDAIRNRFGFTALVSGDALALTQTMPHDRRNLHFRTPCLTR